MFCHVQFCTLNVHIKICFCMGFRHAHICMNDYPYSYGFRHVHVFTNDYPFLLNGFSSYTFLYEWLPFLFELIVVMHTSVQMTTISFWMDFRHAHVCKNDYHFVVYVFSSCTLCANDYPYSLYMDFRHAYFCANDFPYLFGFPCV